jgi:hypothetical protein
MAEVGEVLVDFPVGAGHIDGVVHFGQGIGYFDENCLFVLLALPVVLVVVYFPELAKAFEVEIFELLLEVVVYVLHLLYLLCVDGFAYHHRIVETVEQTDGLGATVEVH